MSLRLPNSCFVHIPRTGGTWFREVLLQLRIAHQSFLGDLDGHLPFLSLPTNWRELPSFSFVRHPLRWLVSRWSHAIEIKARENYRHYGIHRLFDELVNPSLEFTMRGILRSRPGLVGETYEEMTKGVAYLVRTVNLENDVPKLLYLLEGIDEEETRKVTSSMGLINTTSNLIFAQDQSKQLPESLKEEFLASETKALDIWTKAVL